jgi:hypothetical protein
VLADKAETRKDPLASTMYCLDPSWYVLLFPVAQVRNEIDNFSFQKKKMKLLEEDIG